MWISGPSSALEARGTEREVTSPVPCVGGGAVVASKELWASAAGGSSSSVMSSSGRPRTGVRTKHLISKGADVDWKYLFKDGHYLLASVRTRGRGLSLEELESIVSTGVDVWPAELECALLGCLNVRGEAVSATSSDAALLPPLEQGPSFSSSSMVRPEEELWLDRLLVMSFFFPFFFLTGTS